MIEASPTAAKRQGEQCQGVRVDGGQCEAVILVSDGWCWVHHPDKAEERRSARARGGANSSNVRRLRRHLDGSSALGPVLDLLLDALGEIHDGQLSPAKGSAMASVARALCTVMETGELAQRVEELELRLA